MAKICQKEKWLGRLASNQGPRDPKSRALPTAPRPSGKEIYSTLWRFCEGIEVRFVGTRLLLIQLNGYIRRLSVAAVLKLLGCNPKSEIAFQIGQPQKQPTLTTLGLPI